MRHNCLPGKKKIVYQVMRVSHVSTVVQFTHCHIDSGPVGHGNVGKQEPGKKHNSLNVLEKQRRK